MAARVLLFGILFTEVVLEPVCAAGGKGTGNNLNGNKNGSKRDGVNLNLSKSSSQNLRIEPGGYVVLGKKGVTLNCLPGNNHDVSWLYNGEPAPPCGIPRCTILDNGSLHFYKKQNLQLAQKSIGRNESINDMYKKHEYRCIGQTSSGGFLRSSPVFIQIADLSYTFKKSPNDVTVHEGEVTRLSCLIDSVPYPPNITWQHNGKSLLSDRNNTKYIMVPPGVLYITSTKQSDAGLYRCIVTNDFIKKTKKSKEAKLTVVPKIKLQESNIPASLFPQSYYNYSLINGSNVTLVCAVSGNPLSFLKWSFVPQRSDGANSAQPRILLNSTTGISILELKNVSIFHAGTYLCSVENVVTGAMEIQNITVDVTVPPTFIKKPINQNCPNGRTARFECQADGVPTPTIYWLKDAENITVNGRKTIYVKENNKVELAISATVPSDSGDYQCVAVNSAGEIWAAGRLQVNASRNSPAAPTELKCYAPSPVKITISWIPPQSLPPSSITAYTVHYSPEGGGKEEVSPEPGNSTSVEVSKLLEPYTNYSFYVRVWNNHGASDQSATIVCATAPSVPKTAPKVTVDVLSSTKLNITWQPLTKKEARGAVVEYKIQWRLHEHPSYRVIFVPANVEHHLLTDLLPGAQYDLRVLARTEKGWPNISESLLGWNTVVMPTSDTDNYNIRNILDVEMINMNASHLKMKWQIKEADFETFKFDSWQIYCESVNGDKLFTALLDKNSTEYLFTNLEPNISYTVGLCIVTKGVSSDCILKIIKSIYYESGNIPVALEANPLSPSSIQLTWTVINKTSVDQYEVCYEPVQYPDYNLSKCVVVNDTKAIIGELKAFTLYRFKVRMLLKDLNSSQFSESIECYTSEDVPGKPEEVQVFQNGTKIRVVWKEPSKTNGIILSYFLSYYSSDLINSTLTWGNMTVPGNKTSVILPDLPLGERYYIMVQAATKAGYGRRSDPIFIFTGVSLSKTSTSSDKQKPPAKSKPDQSLGIILGVGISICFIIISLCSIYCRKKWEHSRSLRESAQPFKNRIFSRNSTTCCIEQSSTSVSQQANNRIGCNEIELAVLCPSSPTSTNPQLDTKGTLANGIETGAKEPLLTSWNSNEENRDLHITENIQYKQSDSPVLKKQLRPDEDLNITELTTLDCTLNSSTTSLNNNLGCPLSTPKKIIPPVIPVLEPNG
ncbi:protogenin-like isoform X2 [Microplitis mediator]|uniref:protogenin-like isoform X2 n=1 Tax=Microplitis mediator TaxID=375433 RepID=UPI0025535436|nr:protogenin-like isoform X2 [Microplitis mediator]